MKTQRLMIGFTVANSVLLLFLLTQIHRASPQEVAPILRGSGLQIVDNQGRIRAEIIVHGPEKVGSKVYPETVLFRMTDPTSGPIVKLTASKNGSALGLSDDSRGGVQLYARDTSSFLRVVNRDGREQMIKPALLNAN